MNKPITIMEYIAHFPGKKRKLYARLARAMKSDAYMRRIKLGVEACFKKNEALYCPDSKVRPRIIFNPDDNLKLYGGWVNG